MRVYKAFLKEELTTKLKDLKLDKFIVLTELELDKLIEGGNIEKIDQTGVTYKLNYSDLRMIITFD